MIRTGDRTAIEWTDATWTRSDSGTLRSYTRQDPTRPGQQERRARAKIGQRWCRECRDWLPAIDVTKNGLCRPHENAAYRERYQASPDRIRARVHARRRGIAPVPSDANLVAELFDGRCAYCGGPHESWDHVVPVVSGGDSLPGNVVPACVTCNSSKKDRKVWSWLASRDVTPHPYLVEYLSMVEAA